MAEAAGTLLSILAARVRDPQFSATSKADMRLILSWAQRMVNAHRERKIITATLTAEARRSVYPISANFSDAVRILSIRQANRDLQEISFSTLQQQDIYWFRATGVRIEQWAPIGRDLFAIYPAPVDATTLSVRYTKLTTDLTADSVQVELDDEEIPAVLDLAALMLDVKGRHLADLPAAVQAATKIISETN